MKEPLSQRILFVLSAVVPASWYAFTCLAFLSSFVTTHRPTSLVWMVSEGLVAVLLMIRRPHHAVSMRPWDWFIGIAGSFLVLCVRPSHEVSALENVGFAFQLVGMAAQIWAKLALGRSFGLVAANRGLVASGPYRLVRHPIYLAYLVTHVGFLIANPSALNFIVYAAVYVLQIARIYAEERVLSQEDAYRMYQREVRFRLVPGVF